MENKYTNFKLVATPGPLEDKSDAPKFVKLWDNFELTNTNLSSLEGKVNWIKKTYTPAKWPRQEIFWFKVFLEVAEGKIAVIESTITNASKDLLNSLIPTKDEKVKISLYLNKNWYPASSVKDENWEYTPTAMDFKEVTAKGLHDAIDEIYKAENNEWGWVWMSEKDLEEIFS